jgi:hypothetical protein
MPENRPLLKRVSTQCGLQDQDSQADKGSDEREQQTNHSQTQPGAREASQGGEEAAGQRDQSGHAGVKHLTQASPG